MPRYPIQERPEWAWWVTPKLLKEKPVHRWYVFPHSFTSELVDALIDEWGLTEKDTILDPFSGAGTTLLASKMKGIPATGYDLSPLAVLAARVKLANYSAKRLQGEWKKLRDFISAGEFVTNGRVYPELVRKALPGKLLTVFQSIDEYVTSIQASQNERDFFRVALLAILPYFSRALISGGWPKWTKGGRSSKTVPSIMIEHVESMLADVESSRMPRRADWTVSVADARRLPAKADSFTAVLTSPPYPNRHDYTRVFGVELMFSMMDWEETRDLRYQSFHSHPEARPQRPRANGYVPLAAMKRALARIERLDGDPRVVAMLRGYFLDMYLFLKEVKRVCRKGARIAVVLGNAQYCGVPVLVDRWTAEIGEQAGLNCDKILAARCRGNSAQQMGRYGRVPSRESVVFFMNK